MSTITSESYQCFISSSYTIQKNQQHNDNSQYDTISLWITCQSQQPTCSAIMPVCQSKESCSLKKKNPEDFPEYASKNFWGSNVSAIYNKIGYYNFTCLTTMSWIKLIIATSSWSKWKISVDSLSVDM